MSGSFALSIILFLCFSVLVELLGCLLPTSLSAPNLTIASSAFQYGEPCAGRHNQRHGRRDGMRMGGCMRKIFRQHSMWIQSRRRWI